METQNGTQEIIRLRKQEEIKFRAINLIYQTERLIELCDNWHPVYKSDKNRIMAIEDREMAKRSKTVIAGILQLLKRKSKHLINNIK